MLTLGATIYCRSDVEFMGILGKGSEEIEPFPLN